MEKNNNKKSRISEIGIVILVLVCALLVMAEMTTNLVKEVNTQDTQVVNTQILPTLMPLPTYPPDYNTPEPRFDS